jgi:hypothetical protein
VTIAILDGPGGGPLPPYPAWLRDSGHDLVLFTYRSAAELGEGAAGYAAVRPVPDYVRSAEVDLGVLELGERRPLSALVATAPTDLVRAGALREHLGLPGQHRAAAVILADVVALRRVLDRAKVPAVPVAQLQRVADLYVAGGRWGYPVHVRRRRFDWGSVSVLAGEDAVGSFTDRGLTERLQWAHGLMVEPWSIAEGGRVVGVRGPEGWRLFVASELERGRRRAIVVERPGAQHAGLVAAARAALSTLPLQDDHPYLVELRRGDGGEWLVDTVRCDVAGDPTAALLGQALHTDVHRATVRAQAGLSQVRWEAAQ